MNKLAVLANFVMGQNTKLLRFFCAGFPAFLIAVPLNIFFVETLTWPRPAAYALVVVFQITTNFFACVLFVFKRNINQRMRFQFFQFISTILIARVLDWLVYSLLVSVLHIHYIIIQIGNVLIFGIAKFIIAKLIIEGRENIV